MEWDHKISYSEDDGIGQGKNISKISKNLVIMGINVKINLFKRQQYCMEKGVVENFQAPSACQETSAIPLDVEINLHYYSEKMPEIIPGNEFYNRRPSMWSKRSSIFGNGQVFPTTTNL